MLLSSSLLALTLASPALANDDADTIVVLGSRPIAESEAAALTIQRKADSLVTVAAADGVGRLPDQNIAQAAGRLPGLAVERDQGQARYISVRGAPNYWTTLSFDGINIVSPEGRDARFDSIPSAIAAQIVVSKAVTPDMPGETVSGNVNIVTRSAFDFAGRHLAAKMGYGMAQLGDRPEKEASIVLSDRFAVGGGELGLLISGSYYQRDMVTDNFESDWEPVTNDAYAGNATRFWAHETENKLYRLTRKNWSMSGRADWKPNANHTISLRSLFTIFTDDEARDNYRFDLDDKQSETSATVTGACAISPTGTVTGSGYANMCVGNTPQQGTIYGIDIRQRSTLRAYKQSIFTNTLEGKHDFGNGWNLHWLGNYTLSKDDRSVLGEASWESPSSRTSRPTVAYNFSNPNVSLLNLYTTLNPSSGVYSAGTAVTDIDSFSKPLSSITFLDAVDRTRAYTGKLVVSKKTQLLGAEASFKLGFQFDQRTKIVDERSLSISGTDSTRLSAIGMPTDYNQFNIATPFRGALQMGYTFHYFDIDKMRAVAAKARALYAFSANTANNYNVREQVYAGFAMGTLRFDWGSLLGGLRIEHVTNRGDAIGTVNTVNTPVTSSSNHTLLLPSAHLNINLDQTKKLRISFSTGAARADYDQMRPNVVISDTNLTISGGNPSVKPERTWGLDAYLEWYRRPSGYFMIGAFYKRASNVLYSQSRSFGSHALDSDGIDRSGYTYSGVTNAGSGRLYGMEVAVQQSLEPFIQGTGVPAWMGGFGVSANLTLNDSRMYKPAVYSGSTLLMAGRNVRLPGTSDLVYNIGGYYEKYGLTLRLQYQRRSMWMDGVADTLADAGDTYWDADDELDFSARYAVTRHISVYFDASNLLNNPGRRFAEPGNMLTASGTPTPFTRGYTMEWERFGRRFSGGVRVTF
ncbi:TonB-dependent receptor [Novosphingobium ovatum]|uniref:TonB-dependent receptor n=1 Tax=Novosphingobium ovatum TaxID=1908523 RepID=UPI0029FF0F52|nr:TonB-dependent receptor [Novosphingobium ovatum]